MSLKNVMRDAGRQADYLFPDDGAAGAGRRGDLSESRLSHLRIDDSVSWARSRCPIPLVEERGFSFDLDVFRASLTDRTKMVVLNSPQNPTGGMIPAEDIAAIADAVRDRDLMVLSDEIYSRIYYGDEPPVSIASMPGMLEKTDHSRRFFEDLCDDRMAHGLWRDAGVSGERGAAS